MSFVLLLSTLSSCVYPTGPIEWERWKTTFPEHSARPVEQKVAAIEAHLLERHLSPEGVLIYRREDRPFDAEDASSYTNLADTAMWTGCLVGAWAYKYGVTGDSADRDRLLRALGGMRLLQDVTGVPGLLSRSLAPAERVFETERPDQEWRPAAPPHTAYRYRGNVSKDQYFGAVFGYAAVTLALKLDASQGDREIHESVAGPMAAIADHIWSNGLAIVDVDGEQTRFGGLQGYIFGFPIGPNASLCLATQLLAWRLTGEDRFRSSYAELVDRGYPGATGTNKFQFLGVTNHNNDVMALMGLYVLAMLEDDPDLRRRYQESLRHEWRLVRHEGNLFYHNVYHAASGRELPPDARRDVELTARLFPTDLRLRRVDLRDHPLVVRSCFSGRKGVPRNRTALPLHLRKKSSFIWKSNPYALVGNTGGGELIVSGVDYLLAYWMAAFHRLEL